MQHPRSTGVNIFNALSYDEWMLKRGNAWLLDFSHNVFSQTGEDGIISKILEMLPARDKWCVEFGAWDGCHFSNTCNLIENAGYSAVLIEPNPEKYLELKNRVSRRPQVLTFNRFVGFSAGDNLDSILRDTPIPRDFDLLSIDIDGNDYHAWGSTEEYRPKVVCIEFNPTIPTEVEYVQPADQAITRGASLLSLVGLGETKGYSLVCVLPFNAFFVRQEDFPLFGIENNDPRVLRRDLTGVTYLFSGFDGSVMLSGYGKLPWHDVPYDEKKMQQLPRLFRKYPDDFSPLVRRLFELYRRWFVTPRPPSS